ncbi:hypothetical protein Q7P37_003422 [Cladosporium fusiforme]
MCFQNFIFCPCTTCAADTKNNFTGVYYDICEEISNKARDRAQMYGEHTLDLNGEAEYHVETRTFSKGRAWNEERDAGVHEDRVWDCEKSGFKFVEDHEAKRTQTPGNELIPEDVL